MDKTYDDPVKSESRERLRAFIERNLGFRSPSDIHVVCFPGAEVEGEEALEVKEVYDPLGIPRGNIAGLECDPKRAERLRGANLGIEVVEKTDLDFFKDTDRKFDVISLDYTGQQTDSVLDSLELIASRAILGNFGVLMTNFLAQRESAVMKSAIQRRYIRFLLRREDKAKEEGRGLDEKALEKLITEGREISEMRCALSYSTEAIMKLGKANSGVLPAFTAHPYEDHVNEKILEAVKANLERPGSKEFFDGLVEEGLMREDWLQEALTNPRWSLQNWLMVNSVAMTTYLVYEHKLPLQAAETLTSFIFLRATDGYYTRDVERHRYVSNKGSAMMVDMFYLRRPSHKLRSSIDDLIVVRDGLLVPNPTYLPETRLRRKILNCFRDMKDLVKESDLPEQEYLGSSYERPARKERISKADAISLLSAGFTPVEIEGVYEGFSKMQLAAFRAHLTMGTYGKTT